MGQKMIKLFEDIKRQALEQKLEPKDTGAVERDFSPEDKQAIERLNRGNV